MPSTAGFILAACILLAGVALVARGILGRVVHRGPACRRCRFDLAGVVRPDLPLAPDARCPECGSRLADHPRAVVYALRTRRRFPLVIGSIILALCLSAIGVISAVRSAPALQRAKPVWMLSAELSSADPKRVQRAADELVRRVNAGWAPPPDRADALIDHVLAIQANPAAAWATGMGDLLLLWRDAGMLDDERWSRFVSAGVAVQLNVRERLRASGEAEFNFMLSSPRFAYQPRQFDVAVADVLLGDHVVVPARQLGTAGVVASGGSGFGTMKPIDLPPGEYPVAAVVELRERGAPPNATPVARYPLAARVTLVGPDEPLVILIENPELAAGVQASVRVDRAVWQLMAAKDHMLELMFDAAANPAAVCHQVTAIWTDPDGTPRSVSLGTVRFREGSSNHSFGIGQSVPAPLPTSVTLRLTPDIAAAEATASFTEIFGGSWDIPNVRIEPPPEGPAPADPAPR